MATDPLMAASRLESYEIRVLDKNEKDLGRLDGVEGGSISCSTDARIKCAGTLNVTATRPVSWWEAHRLQVWVTVNGVRWPLGVFIPASPSANHFDGRVEFEVEISDKLLFLDQDMVEDAYSVPTGTNLAAHVVSIIRGIGETKIAITPSPKVNKRPLTWDAGTEKLTIINDILDYIGYFSLTVNGFGQFEAGPYVEPADRPVRWRFIEGKNALHLAEFTYHQDLANIPNKVIYIVTSASTTDDPDDGEQVMKAVAINNDPTSPYSFQARGRWITEKSTDIEADSQEELEKKVRTRLKNAMNPMVKIEIENAVLPLQLNHIADFQTAGVERFCSVRKWELELRPGALMKTTLRGVNKKR